MRDEYETSIFLAQFLTRMVDKGHSNKILMANRAIAAQEARLAEGERQYSRRQAQPAWNSFSAGGWPDGMQASEIATIGALERLRPDRLALRERAAQAGPDIRTG